jgi:phospho-N-acetylmuramoyl-pentapeptide-transferase
VIEALVVPFLVAFGVGVVCTAAALPFLRRLPVGQVVRDDGPATHLRKQGTPSMGGVAVFVAIVIAAAVLGLAGSPAAGVLPLVGGFALTGFVDDILKARGRQSHGWKARYRLLVECVLAIAFGWYVIGHVGPLVYVPGEGMVSSPGLFWPLCVLAVVGGGNGVNFADGLDGLASGLVGLCAATLAGAAFAHGHLQAASLGALLAGTAAAFLLFNRHPARVFMGDTGSLALGAGLGGVAVASGMPLIFAVAGLVFAAEVLSVIIQVVSFQRTGRRVFRMAPLHHHFELAGLPETAVTHRFWLAGIALAAIALLLARIGS